MDPDRKNPVTVAVLPQRKLLNPQTDRVDPTKAAHLRLVVLPQQIESLADMLPPKFALASAVNDPAKPNELEEKQLPKTTNARTDRLLPEQDDAATLKAETRTALNTERSLLIAANPETVKDPPSSTIAHTLDC